MLPAPDTAAVTIFHNRVYLPARINGAELDTFVLDNGASVSGVSDVVAHRLRLRATGGASITGNGDRVSQIALTSTVSFAVGRARVTKPRVALLPLADFFSLEGRSSAGVLGKDFFARYVVDVDYASGRLILYDPATYRYEGPGVVIPLHISRDSTAAWMRARLTLDDRRSLDARLGLDIGTYSALRFYRPFVERERLVSRLASTRSFGFGIGGEFEVGLARVARLQTESLALDDVPAELSLATGGATTQGTFDGTIGGAILRRYRVIIDYSRSRMILEPNARSSEPFATDVSGLLLEARGAARDTIVIRRVAAGSAASNVGLRPGDVIVEVDGVAPGAFGLDPLRRTFSRAATNTLLVQRGTAKFRAELITRASTTDQRRER